ncbi:MAG: universal stress protein [Pyrinomonadaceae bacterium]
MKILIATDGSEFSDAAVEECCRIITGPEGTQVKVMSTYHEVVPIDNFAQSAEYAKELEQKEHGHAEAIAGRAADRIRECHPGVEITEQVSVGAADRSIIESAEEWGADLVVIGSHGRGFWGRLLVGSVTDAVVHHAPCSVLVVRKKSI